MRTILPVATAAALLAGCSGTSLVNSWADSRYRQQPLQNIVIHVQAPDALTANASEDELVTALQKTTRATPAYRVYPAPVTMPLPPAERERLRALLVERGFDGVLVTRVSNIKKTEKFVPPEVVGSYGSSYGSSYGWGGWGDGFSTYYSQPVVRPGYTYVQTNYYVDCALYALPSGALVWTAQTESTDPRNKQRMIEAITRLFSQSLATSGVVAR